MENINKIKRWFFEKINKTNKFLARLIGGKKKAQIIKIINKRGEITTNGREIQRIIREYHKLLYDSKMDNLEKMNNFLEMYNGMNHEIENNIYTLLYIK